MSVIFHGAFRWFFTIKNYLCAGDYAATVCAIKSTQLKQGQTTRCVFFNARTVSVAIWQTIYFFVIRKTTFRTRKRFHNKQYPPKSKVQPHGSERTHFDTGFNNSNVAMHRQTFIFLLSHKITDVQQKTTNRNNQSHQTITTNNPRNHSINKMLKTKHNKYEKPSHQSIVKSITKTTTTNNPKSLNQKHAQNKT